MCSRKSTDQQSRGFGFSHSSYDPLGRDITFHDGKQICNNFNGVRGCIKPYCKYYHVCKQCKSTSHGRVNCNANKNAGNIQWKSGQKG